MTKLNPGQSRRPYPQGMDWRCPACEYRCDDSGPDFCPNDGAVLTRVLMTFPLLHEDREDPS